MRPESGKIKRSRKILVNRLSQPKDFKRHMVGYENVFLCLKLCKDILDRLIQVFDGPNGLPYSINQV